MKDGNSGEFMIAFHAYHENGLLPSVFMDLPLREKAMIAAFIDVKLDAQDKEAKKAKPKSRRRGR